jgi:hypothetical protein
MRFGNITRDPSRPWLRRECGTLIVVDIDLGGRARQGAGSCGVADRHHAVMIHGAIAARAA